MDYPIPNDPAPVRPLSGTAIPARYAEQRARVLSILKRWESAPSWVLRRSGRDTGLTSR
jgi:hypothetical protein